MYRIVTACCAAATVAGCGGYSEPTEAEIVEGMVSAMDGQGGLKKIAEGSLQLTAPGGWNTIRIDIAGVTKHGCTEAENAEGYLCDFTADVRQSVGDGEGGMDRYSSAMNTLLSLGGARGTVDRYQGRFYRTEGHWMYVNID